MIFDIVENREVAVYDQVDDRVKKVIGAAVKRPGDAIVQMFPLYDSRQRPRVQRQ